MLTFAVAWYCVRINRWNPWLVFGVCILDAMWIGSVGGAAFS
jgi:hypothetical protein